MDLGLVDDARHVYQEGVFPYSRLLDDYPGQGMSLSLRRRLHNALMLAMGDVLALSLAMLLAGAVRFWWLGAPFIPSWSWILIILWWLGALLLRLLPSWGLGVVEELRKISTLLLIVYAAIAVTLFLSKQASTVSRLTLTIALAASLFSVPLVRVRVKRLLVTMGKWGIPVVIYGARQTGARVIHVLRQEGGLGYNPVGLFDDDPDRWGGSLNGVPVLGGTDLILATAPVAFLAMPGISRARKLELLEGPLSCYRSVLVIPDLFGVPSLWVQARDLNGVLGLEITSNLTSPMAMVVKRAMDVALSLVSAPLWVPLCSFLALLVWLEDNEHPLFLQERVGKGGRLFKTWKFRTMVPNAEEVLSRKLAEDALLRREWKQYYKLQKDPRITRIGRLLRRFSLDELPQLLNVLRGEMSLVGPRPLPRYHHDQMSVRLRDLRMRVRPGLTGLWQVSGRANTGMEEMEQWDGYYVRNWSPWLDAVVLVRTVRAVARGSGV